MSCHPSAAFLARGLTASPSFLSTPVDVGDAHQYALQATFTVPVGGSAEGSIEVEVSVDGEGWAVYAGSNVNVAIVTSTTWIWDFNEFGHNAARVRWTPTSVVGAVTLTVTATKRL